MTYPKVRLVDAPDPSATVLYDFNDRTAAAERWVASDGFTLGSPTLEGDPKAVDAAYGFRQPVVPQRIRGSKHNALQALTALSRQLLRRSGWLMVQLDALTEPVWLRIYRAGYEALSLSRVFVRTSDGGKERLPDTWEIQVPFLADAFGYLERVVIPTATLGNSASATNRLRYVLPAVQGDAPTHLRVKVTPQGNASTKGYAAAWLVGCVAGGATVVDPVIDIGTGDVWTADSGLSGANTDTAYLGGSYRTITIAATGAPANSLKRMHGTLATAPPVGRYRVLLRCEADPIDSLTPNRYVLALGQTVNGEDQWGPTVTLDTPAPVSARGLGAFAFQGWVDLGDFTFPFAIDPPDGANLTPPQPVLALKAGTAAGNAGVIRADAFKLIPVDGPAVISTTLMRASFESARTNFVNGIYALDYTLSCTWDGDSERTWETTVSTGALVDGVPMQAGAYPLADPAAVENVLEIFPLSRGRTSSALAATAEAKTWNIDVSYHPRTLHFGSSA